MKDCRKIIALLAFISFSQIIIACNVADSVTEIKKINAFTTLKVKGNFNIVFTNGSCSLKIVASDKDAMAAIDIKSTTILAINMKDGATGTATLYIGIKDIQQIVINTNGWVSCTNAIDVGDLALNIDGNVTGTLNLDVKVLNCNSNSGKALIMKGKAKACTFKDGGEGSLDASALKTDNLTLEDSSDGDLKVYAHPEMHVKIMGSGTLTYYGNPRVKTFKVSGQATEQQIVESK
ncbi:MAG TPA: DUF2807 domain-containing protein [Bacteroidia bacterium]|jgi:hypothetical protein|nr:DUF2807 domain-containing protein [Bacteroidia bacterium]